MSVLETKEVSFAYKDGDSKRLILDNVSVCFEKQKLYSILGVSGSGKTTFLALLSALDVPQGGEMLFHGENIQKIGLNEYRRKNIGIVFQSYNLITYMSAFENVMLAMGIANKADAIEAMKLLKSVGIDEEKANRKVTHLSGGEQQRVAIARAVVGDVEVILADEPTGNLDRETSQKIVEIFKELAHKQNKCVIIATHSTEVAEQSDVVLKLDADKRQFVIEQ